MRPHGDKIDALLRNASFASKQDKLQEIQARYLAWRASIEGVSDRSHAAIKRLTEQLNAYKDFIDHPRHKQRASGFSAQTFLHSSVLEEFLVVLFSPLLIGMDVSAGGKNTYVEMKFRPRNLSDFLAAPPIAITTKDQDFAIGRSVAIVCGYDDKATRTMHAFVPLLCLECKTNFDKTMYTAASDTARCVKQGAPACFFAVVIETNDLARDFNLQGSSIDQIYWLRHPDRNHSSMTIENRSKIDANPVQILYDNVAAHLKKTWFDLEKGEKTGVLI